MQLSPHKWRVDIEFLSGLWYPKKSTMFEPGDKVICVNDRDIDPLGIKIHGGKRPIENQLYCIEDCWTDNDIIFAVSLVGMPAIPRAIGNARFGWFAWRFRKVEELRESNRVTDKAEKPSLAPN